MTRLRALAPLLVAATLAAVAVLTVQQAGCDAPGHFEAVPGGYELVGGCLNPNDLVVPAPAPPAKPVAGSDVPSRS